MIERLHLAGVTDRTMDKGCKMIESYTFLSETKNSKGVVLLAGKRTKCN